MEQNAPGARHRTLTLASKAFRTAVRLPVYLLASFVFLAFLAANPVSHVLAQPSEPADPLTLYDANDNGAIDADEVIQAMTDYRYGRIDGAFAYRVWRLYEPPEDVVTTRGWTSACNDYDEDGSGVIEQAEVFDAIDDYFDGLIDKVTVFAVINCYYSATHSIEIDGLPDTLQAGGSVEFTVEASNLVDSGDDSFTISVTTNNRHIGFDGNCSDRPEEVSFETNSDNANYSSRFTLYACSVPGGRVNAKLSLSGDVGDLVEASQDVIVTTEPVTDVNRPPEFTDGESTTRSVPENTPSGRNIVNAVIATDPDRDTLTYSLSGTDASSFTVNESRGRLQTNAALDYETKSSYTLLVSASDGRGGADSITVTITVTNVNEAPEITGGDATVRFSEEGTGPVETYEASDVDSDTTRTWSLIGGADHNLFNIDSSSGALTFKTAPDFESPTDADRNNKYNVTVSVRDNGIPENRSDTLIATLEVTVTVTNVNELGAVTLSPSSPPAVGTTITASLSDPDGHIRNEIWQWRNTDGDINGAISSSYTPRAADAGKTLSATVTYDDGHGTGKSAASPETSAVIGKPGKITDLKVVPGDATLTLSWDPPLSDGGAGIWRYHIQHVASGLPWTDPSRVDGYTSFAETMYRIRRLTNGTEYKVRVRAQNRSRLFGDWIPGTNDSDVTGTPVPALSIAVGNTSILEGGHVVFTVTATTAATKELTLNVNVSETGSHISSVTPMPIKILRGHTTGSFTVSTMGDSLVKRDDEITAEIQSGSDYIVGMPSEASVTVKNVDMPPVPTDLRANGHIVNGNITLRWDGVKGAVAYNVQFVEMTCPQPDSYCEPKGGWANPNWQPPVRTSATGRAVLEEREIELPHAGKLYRVEVRTVSVDPLNPSDWSEYTLVYPTDAPPSVKETRVATVELSTFQTDGLFGYDICNPSTGQTPEQPLPSGVTTAHIETAIGEWERTVRWEDSNRDNIIRTSGSVINLCEHPTNLNRTRNQVMFLSEMYMEKVCGDRKTLGCRRLSGTLTQATTPQAIFLRSSAAWTSVGSKGCTRLHEVLVHESGHAFGFSHTFAGNAVMRQEYYHTAQLCKPQTYDIVAAMANYQSR